MGLEKNNAPSCTPTRVNLHRCVSVLPNDYSQLENVPKINGVSLMGDLKAGDLGLLSSNPENYETVSVLDKKDGYIVLLGGAKPEKIALDELLEQAGGKVSGEGFVTVNELDTALPIGSYQFVKNV